MIKQITQQQGVMNENKTNEKKIWKGRKPNPEYLPLKRCKTCGEVKTLDEFHTNPSCHGGYLHQCKSCQSKQMIERHKTVEGKEVLVRAMKKYYRTPKGRFTSVKNGHKVRGGGKITMTQDEFVTLMENQTNCAICGVEFSKNVPPVTDHIIAIKNEEGKPSPLSVENIQLLCGECSLIKGNRSLSPADILSIKLKRQLEKEEYYG